MILKNKRGWVRIVEAFVAVLLVTGIVLLIVSQKNVEQKELDLSMYEKQIGILRKIQLNDTLREVILSVDPPLASFETNYPGDIQMKINSEAPDYLACVSKICDLNDSCTLEGAEIEIKQDIYSKSISIFSTNSLYSPKQLKLFCWVR